MAIVRSNPIVEGLSGMLGKSIVFKTLRGKIILANRPSPPKKQSELQRANRKKFRDASFWAKSILRDPIKKEYYQKKARKLKLPNAYTAAITDYMRPAQVKETDRRKNVVTYRSSQRDFDVKNVESRQNNENGELIETQGLIKDNIKGWTFTLHEEEIQCGVYLNITNTAGRLTSVKLRVC